jgi:hypothetical protein
LAKPQKLFLIGYNHINPGRKLCTGKNNKRFFFKCDEEKIEQDDLENMTKKESHKFFSFFLNHTNLIKKNYLGLSNQLINIEFLLSSILQNTPKKMKQGVSI